MWLAGKVLKQEISEALIGKARNLGEIHVVPDRNSKTARGKTLERSTSQAVGYRSSLGPECCHWPGQRLPENLCRAA